MTLNHALAKLEAHWSGEPPVESILSVEEVENSLGSPLPANFKAFLMWSDGGETLAPYLRMKFYSLSELLRRRADGQPPDTLEFATDDSCGFAFDLRRHRDTASYPVVTYPLGDTTRESVELEADDFLSFIVRITRNSALGWPN